MDEMLLRLSRDRLKELCRAFGLDDSGRRKADLTARLVGPSAASRASTSQIAGPKRDDGVAQATESAPVATPPSDPPDILSVAQLEQYLWSAADILRGSIDSSDYKTYIFGLLFLKRLSDQFEEKKNLSTWAICKMNMLLVIDGRRRQPRAGRRRTVGTAAGGEAVSAQPSPCEWQRMSARRCAKWRQPCGDPCHEFIEITALAQSRAAPLVDDANAVAIPSDDALAQRMKSGSRRARCHEGDIAHGACTSVVRWRHVLEPPQSESRCC